MISVSNYFQNQISAKQGVELFRKLIVTDLKGTEDIDLTSFISRWGSISRKLQYETGKFSPGGHSFSIQDSKALGKFLFTLGKEFGTEYWMDKEYSLLFGFLNGQSEDTIDLGTFKITSKSEDRITGQISISAHDSIKEISDYKICTKVDSREVFDYSDATFDDTRGFQQVIRYGTHKILTNSSEVKELKNRDNPFSATVGFPNISAGDVSNSFTAHPVNHVFYFPFQNEIDITESLYTSVLKLYFWDYIDERWRAFASSEFTDNNITIERSTITGAHDGGSGASILTDTGADFVAANVKPGFIVKNTTDGSEAKITAVTTTTISGTLKNGTDNDWDASDGYEIHLSPGVYVTIETPGSVTTKSGSTFTDYVNGTTGFSGAEEDERDIALAIESIDNLKSGTDHNPNPVRIIHDLLTSPRFIQFSESQLDLSDLDSPDLDFSFDRTYNFLDDSSGFMNVLFDKEDSLLKVIESITSVGAMFFYSVPKVSGSDRRLKLQIQQPFNPCEDKPSSATSFSTKDYISSIGVSTSSDSRVDQVKVVNFDSSKSTKESFDIRSTPGDPGGKVLQFGADSSPKAYWYNSSGIANAIASRYLNWFKVPQETYNITVGKAGIPTEIFDFIQVHDEISDETTNVQVYETRQPLDSGNVTLEGRRFEQLFSPDLDEPLKKWAFATVGGTHTGFNDSASLTDSAATFQTWGVKVGDTIRNDTDGSEGTVNAVPSETSLTVSLSGGTDSDFDTGDVYYIGVECASFATTNEAPSGKVTAPHSGESWHAF